MQKLMRAVNIKKRVFESIAHFQKVMLDLGVETQKAGYFK